MEMSWWEVLAVAVPAALIAGLVTSAWARWHQSALTASGVGQDQRTGAALSALREEVAALRRQVELGEVYASARFEALHRREQRERVE